MNREFILKNTTSFTENLLKRLQDLEFAQYYLEAALEDYEKDGDTESLWVALRDVAQAQGGIGKLSKQTDMSRQQLDAPLACQCEPRLDHVLAILSGLGFRVRLEHQAEQSTIPLGQASQSQRAKPRRHKKERRVVTA